MTLFKCERLHASISERQCSFNRSSGHISCRDCSGVSESVEVEMPTIRECKECGRVMPLSGRGLCGKCYTRLIKLEKAEQAEQADKQIAKCDAISDVVPADDPVDPPVELRDRLRQQCYPDYGAEARSLLPFVPPGVIAPDYLMQAWEAAGYTHGLILGLMELMLNGELYFSPRPVQGISADQC